MRGRRGGGRRGVEERREKERKGKRGTQNFLGSVKSFPAWNVLCLQVSAVLQEMQPS
jgi:hypothetical protein